jgi:hypothetical protein
MVAQPGIPALRRWRQEDHEFENIARLCSKTKRNKTKQKNRNQKKKKKQHESKNSTFKLGMWVVSFLNNSTAVQNGQFMFVGCTLQIAEKFQKVYLAEAQQILLVPLLFRRY